MASRKLKLRDLSRIQPEFQELMDVSAALSKELHPITRAILGAAIVEYQPYRVHVCLNPGDWAIP